MSALRLRWRGQMNINEGASPATLKVKSHFGQVLFRIASACTGGVSHHRAGWESHRTNAGLARVLHHPLAAPTLYRQIIAVLNFALLWGVQWVSVFDEEPHANRILFVWPFHVSDHCPGGTGQKMSCNNLNLQWESEGLEVLSPWSCSRTEVEAEAGDESFSSLLLQWNNHSPQLCNLGVSWEWPAPAESWGLAVRGRKGFREPTLTLQQVVTIRGEILTCTVQVWAQWLPYESS